MADETTAPTNPTTPVTPAAPVAPPASKSLVGEIFVVSVVTNLLTTAALVAAFWFLVLPGWNPLSPKPVPKPFDPSFVSVGQAFPAELASEYAAAWEAGADAIDSGMTVTGGQQVVGKQWDAGRSKVFDAVATPHLLKIVPEGATDANITASQRAAVAKAWRGIAQGLRK